MEFKKVTISLPKNLYEEAMNLINRGLFSNISDLIRSGIRNEFKDLEPVIKEFDEKLIYSDQELIKGVAQSRKEAKEGKGVLIKSDKELDKYFEAL
jgi:Arc/MetJ-type ribon-helix-helix transcriptional regulator